MTGQKTIQYTSIYVYIFGDFVYNILVMWTTFISVFVKMKSMKQLSKKSYIVCSTPRTGSSFFCSLLKSTGLAGYPESYFRKQDIDRWALKLGVTNSLNEIVNPDEYVNAVVKSGSTDNGIFATRIMWGTMQEVLGDFLLAGEDDLHTDLEVLTEVLGQMKFVYLQRSDVVAQAVSRWRAEQTNVWHNLEDSKDVTPDIELEYNFEKIHGFVLEVEEHSEHWNKWFLENNIQPHKVIYEDLINEPMNVIKKTLSYLEIDVPEDISISAPNKKLADEVNREWIERYKKSVL